MQKIVSIEQNECKKCYSCIRSCPADAIQIKNGQASIIESRCINCGICTQSCAHNARVIMDSKIVTNQILNQNKKVIACLGPSFVSTFYKHSYKKVLGALKELGFSEVWEVAVGAEALSKQISEFIDGYNEKTYMSSACPAFVSLIEKHYPELIDNMLPFVSPMIATGKIIKKHYKNEDVKIVFIGPCIAKKSEAMEEQFEGIIDSVITYKELKEMIDEENIKINDCIDSEFDSPLCEKGRLFPLYGGLIQNLDLKNSNNESEYIKVEGKEGCFRVIEFMLKNKPSFKFVDSLMCDGCIEGPMIDSDLSYYEKSDKVYKFYEQRKEEKSNMLKLEYDIDFNRRYKSLKEELPHPSEEDIQKILRKTDKYTKEDELNCGSCGYKTCRDKAIAVNQGLAEADMCLPYLVKKRTKLLEKCSHHYKQIATLKNQLETVIESSYDGLVVTDGQGKIIKTNKAWKKMLNCDKNTDKDVCKQNNTIFSSATLIALKEKRTISFLQKEENEKKYLATATPILDEDGNVDSVVTNVRDVEKLNDLMEKLQETDKLDKYHSDKDKKSDLKNDITNENIVANSIEFGEVLQIGSSVARVDSTVLILGESGVGKEVVAKFIHNLSKRKDNSFIKINCGAIPENLIESELFGYETGAFTGAKKKGKSGLIELAHKGTLFLDEIGELPLNLQVKLLRVIQEKKLIRVGGTEEKDVDVRIIAATNRDLYKMVQERKFRADLYYRLNVVPLEVPPLRKRYTDIIPLTYHFLEIFNNKYDCNKDITAEVKEKLREYSWPGNVRELENLIERLVVTTRSNIISQKELPRYLFDKSRSNKEKIKLDEIIPLKEATETVEKKLIEEVYERYDTTYEMAKVLKVNQSTVVRKIKKYIKNNAVKHN